MRIKLDENLPIAAAAVAVQLGHDVDTVNGERLTGASDSDVVAAATTDGRLVITLDRRLAGARVYPPGIHAGIAVLRGGAGFLRCTCRAQPSADAGPGTTPVRVGHRRHPAPGRPPTRPGVPRREDPGRPCGASTLRRRGSSPTPRALLSPPPLV